MKLLWAVILSAVFASALANCGCLKCCKHLKVISPPHAPVTVIERGEACICPKPIPYHIEIPDPVCKPCERKTYGYRIQTVRYVQPKEPVMCEYGYHVQIPKIKKDPCDYCVGLVAKTDRVVVPAVDECVPPKPTRCCPIIEYLQPKCICRRQKRNVLNKDGRGNTKIHKGLFSMESNIDWSRLLEPKEIKSIFARSPWEKLLKSSTLTTKNNLFEKMNYRERLQKNKKPHNSIKEESRQDKPFRINVPLNPRKQFFPYGKPKPKYKRPFQKIHENRTNIDFVPDQETKPVKSRTFEKFIRKSGKFADVENVQIALPQINRNKKIFEIPRKKIRKIRSVTLKDKSLPFYKLSRSTDENYGEYSEDCGKNFIENERIQLQKQYLKPFDVETILPQNQVFYMLNTPIRMLNQIHKLREHVSPMVKSLPNVLDTSANYIVNLGKRFKRGAMDLFKEFVGNVKVFPGNLFLNFLRPSRRNKRGTEKFDERKEKEDSSLKFQAKRKNIIEKYKNVDLQEVKNNNKAKLSKRAIVKLVEEDDVHEFLREKLSIFASSEEKNDRTNENEDVLLPVIPEIPRNLKNKHHNRSKSKEQQLILEKLEPKLILNGGKPILDINGSKRVLTAKKRHHETGDKNEDIQSIIDDVIEEARLMATKPKVSNNEGESQMPMRSIKSQITLILEKIQTLIEQGFERYEDVYEALLKLQHLKESVVEEWKYILIIKKHNDFNGKINLLNKINEMLSLKDDIIEKIGEILAEDRSFNNQSLVKILVRLQKLQCVLVKTVEDFAEHIRYGTLFDVKKEIKQVDFLEKLDLVKEKTFVELSAALRKDRDVEVEKQVELLDNLKELLECEICENKSDKINEVAKLLWEINNSEKLQKETVFEMNDKIQYGYKIRKELKIIFDLEKQMEICEKKLNRLFDDILKEKARKINVPKQIPTISKYGKLLRKKPPLKKIPLKKPLSFLKKKQK